MAIVAKLVKDNTWFQYQPEWGNNRDPFETDPLILEIQYVTHRRNLKYSDELKLGRQGKIKDGEVPRISEKKFKDNVRIKSGWYVPDDKEPTKNIPSTDMNILWAWASQDFIDEINDAMTNVDILEKGDPKHFKLLKK